MAKSKRSTARAAWRGGFVAYSVADGRELAVQLLREVEGEADDCYIDPEIREGKPQNNILLRYLRVVRESGSVELEEGFAQVLSDFTASSINGCTPDATFYEGRIQAK